MSFLRKGMEDPKEDDVNHDFSVWAEPSLNIAVTLVANGLGSE